MSSSADDPTTPPPPLGDNDDENENDMKKESENNADEKNDDEAPQLTTPDDEAVADDTVVEPVSSAAVTSGNGDLPSSLEGDNDENNESGKNKKMGPSWSMDVVGEDEPAIDINATAATDYSNSNNPSLPPQSGDNASQDDKDKNESINNKTEQQPPTAATKQQTNDETPVVEATPVHPAAATTDSKSNNNENTLEDAFALIQKGNKLQKENGDFWEASQAYCQAQAILQNLAAANTTTAVDAEAKMIQELYQRQSREYFFKAREALVSAMKDESTSDQQSAAEQQPHSHQSLSDELAMERLRLFARLYARESILVSSSRAETKDAQPENVQEQQSSLEERLMQLNQSLPSGFKTSEERMRDINRGLNRLGLSSVTTTSNNHTGGGAFSSIIPPPSSIPKSEGEQVDDIIAQARDEVAMQQQQYGTPGQIIGDNGIITVPGTSLAEDVGAALLSGVDKDDEINDVNDSSSSSSMDSDDVDNVDLTVDDIRLIQEQVNEAQSQLAQLNALLQLDPDNHAEIEFDPSSGRHALDRARKCLTLAKQKWQK